jgi:hypothetical protein
MSNEKFAEQLRNKLNEALNYGTQDTPVQKLSFPEPTSTPTNLGIPSDTQVNVTNGETKALGEPRSDLELQKQGGPIDAELTSEISSLLISIGYLLSKESIVPDKFNVPAVLDFLNTHFKQKEICANPEIVADVEIPPTNMELNAPSSPIDANQPVAPVDTAVVSTPVEDDEVKNLTYANPNVQAYMESRINQNKALKTLK